MEEKARRYSVHREAEYDRLRKKTREHEFVGRFEREFEFSPRESRGVLEVVAETFFDTLLSKNLKQFTSCLTGHYRARSLKKTSGSEICFIVNCSITSLLDLEENPQLSGDGSRFKLLEGEKFMSQFT